MIAMSENVTFCAEIKWETELAYILSDGDNEFPVPKSLVIDMDQISDGEYEFTVPEWFAIQEEII